MKSNRELDAPSQADAPAPSVLPTAPYAPSTHMRHPQARERRLLFHQLQHEKQQLATKHRPQQATVGRHVVPLPQGMMGEAAAFGKQSSQQTSEMGKSNDGQPRCSQEAPSVGLGAPRQAGHRTLLLPAVISPGGSAVSLDSQRRMSPKAVLRPGGSPLGDMLFPAEGASTGEISPTSAMPPPASNQLVAREPSDAPSADDLLAWLAANSNNNNNDGPTAVDDRGQPLVLPRLAHHRASGGKSTSWSSRMSAHRHTQAGEDDRGTVAAPNTFLLSQRVTGYSREQHIKYMEAFIARQCASSRGLDARADGYCRALDAVCDLNPVLVNIYSTVKHFLKEVVKTTQDERQHHAENIVAMRKRTHAEQQEFYEAKFVKTLAEKSEWQRKCKVLTEEVIELKKQRDADLMLAKAEVLGAVHKVHEDEEDIQSMRSLVTTIFKVNRENELRVNQLQDCLLANRIAIPPRFSEDDHDGKQRTKKQKAQHHVVADISASTGAPDSHAAPEAETASALVAASPTGRGAPAYAGGGGGGGGGANSDNSGGGAASAAGAPSPHNKPTATSAQPNEEDEESEFQRFMQPRLRDQVSLDFVAASKRELEQCRLSTQRVLVTCASETQSSYKLLVASLTAENQRLKAALQQLREDKDGLERFVHEKRFAQRARQEADRDEKMLAALEGSTLDAKQRTVLNRDGSPAGKPLIPSLPTLNVDAIPHLAPVGDDVPREQLTPRPALPFEIQPALGVDLRQSTARLTSELASVALNLKAQLEEMHVRVRRLASCVSWMDEWTVNRVVQQDDPPFLPVAPTAEWDHCHHFLRTTVQPHVPNLKWTAAFTSSLVMRFFEAFAKTREAARWERDAKMLAPRAFQPYERRFHALIPLDATVEELSSGPVDQVPLGYVVSQFLIKEMLVSDADRSSCVSDLVQSRTTVPKLTHRFLEVPLELELAKVAYNFWFAARKYRKMEPLCGLFVDVVEGKLPPSVYGLMQHVNGALHKKLIGLDAAKSGLLSYKQITSATHNALSDYEPEIQRGAVFAVAQTLEAKGIPLIGTVSISELMSDEKRVVPRRSGSTTTIVGVQLLANAAQTSLPNGPSNPAQVLAGASIFTKYLRRLVMQRLDAVYRHIEAVTYPCVKESVAVKGMFLLRLSASIAVLSGHASPPEDAPSMPNASLSSPPVAPLIVGPQSHRDVGGTYLQSPGTLGATAIFTPPARTPLEENDDVGTAPGAESNAGGSSIAFTPKQHRLSVGPHGVAGHVHDDADDTPPFLHVASVPICLGDVVCPLQRLVATPDPNLIGNFNRIVEPLQHYSSSVHFPDTGSTVGGDGAAAKDPKSGKLRKQKSFARSKTQQTMQQVATNDQDWVEWYSFLYAMRTTALVLPDACCRGWAPPSGGAAWTPTTPGGATAASSADAPAASIPPMPPSLTANKSSLPA